MHPLQIPVPPQLETAVGYAGDARWVALYWTPSGDEAVYDDGRTSGTGNWSGYLTYVRHPAVALELAGYNLGSSDAAARTGSPISPRQLRPGGYSENSGPQLSRWC